MNKMARTLFDQESEIIFCLALGIFFWNNFFGIKVILNSVIIPSSLGIKRENGVM